MMSAASTRKNAFRGCTNVGASARRRLGWKAITSVRTFPPQSLRQRWCIFSCSWNLFSLFRLLFRLLFIRATITWRIFFGLSFGLWNTASDFCRSLDHLFQLKVSLASPSVLERLVLLDGVLDGDVLAGGNHLDIGCSCAFQVIRRHRAC